MPDDPVLPKNDLPVPARVLVFSFYDAPNPEEFFAEISAWITGNSYNPAAPLTASRSYGQIIPLLETCDSVLLVLDGVERVQEDGTRGTVFGQLADSRIRDFVARIAEGHLRGVSLVLTTRFRVFDIVERRSPFYLPISIDTLSPASAVALLRSRGVVRGSDQELLSLAESQGFHALTIDLIGGYIALFCNGEISQLSPDLKSLLNESEVFISPELWALREQEKRFTRVAERYRNALAQRDPAALSLLERVCLFRLGVEAERLASIFTGDGKDEISGVELAKLDQRAIKSKLAWLVEMRLLEITRREHRTEVFYTVHPAVKDSFLRSIDPSAERLGHAATRSELQNILGGKPRLRSKPAQPEVLDLLEEVIYHAIKSDSAQEAWEIYWHGLGGYQNLGWRLGAYARGERICRMFVGDYLFSLKSFPACFTAEKKGLILNEWAMYLASLGRLESAAELYNQALILSRQIGDAKNATAATQNFTRILLMSGRLRSGLSEAESVLAQGHAEADRLRTAHAYSGYAKSLRGNILGAQQDFITARQMEGKREEEVGFLYSLPDLYYCSFLCRIGEVEVAIERTERNRRTLQDDFGINDNEIPLCNLLFGELLHREIDLINSVQDNVGDIRWLWPPSLRAGRPSAEPFSLLTDPFDDDKDLTRDPQALWLAAYRMSKIAGQARQSTQRALHAEKERQLNIAQACVDKAKDWALPRDAMEPLCWSYLLEGRISLERFLIAGMDDCGYIRKAFTSIDEGLRLAKACGFGLHFLDLLIIRAQCLLIMGDENAAIKMAQLALYGPTLSPAQIAPKGRIAADLNIPVHIKSQECGYAWAEADARYMLAEGMLLKAAKLIGTNKLGRQFRPKEAEEFIAEAFRELQECCKIRQRIQDPKLKMSERRLSEARSGMLTRYDLDSAPPEDISMDGTETPRTTPEFDVFISHNRKDLNAVRELSGLLRSRGLKVWLDEWELVPGRPWQEALEDAIENSRTVAVLIGENGLGPWETPEMRGALSESVRRGIPIIPIFLPGAPSNPSLPMFLARYKWVDLRGGLIPENIDLLEWGITGTKPGTASA
jgi:tetratricopeptide (TPR) repeat protein